MPLFQIPEKWKTLWDLWDLRVAVLTSLFFQILLINIASLRRRSGNLFLTMFVWSTYLLADWIATFAVGLIASSLSDCDTTAKPGTAAKIGTTARIAKPGKPILNEDLITFWAPFLLVHLGGPHNITAFSLEDNELWIRHLFQLIVHLITIAYVFTQSLPNDLWIPIILVYIAGFIKYFERTRSLYRASLDTLKTSTLPPPMAGSNYARLMQAYVSKEKASIPVNIVLAERPEIEPPDYPDVGEQSSLNGILVVQIAYRFFRDFKGLIVDLTYGFREWQKTRELFFKMAALDAFHILEVELNFMYDLLYTKMVVVHGKYGFCFRILCLVLFAVALGLFVSHHKHHKHEIHGIDMYITYILLIGAIGLDIFGIIKLFLSDWTIAALSDVWIPDRLKNCKEKLLPSLFAFRINLSFDKNYRWSRCISQHSLVTHCLKKVRFKYIDKLVDIFGAKEFVEEFLYKKTVRVEDTLTKNVSEKQRKLSVGRWMKVLCHPCLKVALSLKKVKEKPVGNNLKVFIFKELREKARKAKTAKDAKEICSWRGETVLLEAPRCFPSLVESVEVEYDESVLRWHLATELCYHTEKNDKDEFQFSKVLSQYMLYLLVMRPTMMSQVTGILQIRFQDTCEEAKKFFGSDQEPTRDAHEEAGKLFRNIMDAIKKFFRFSLAGNKSQLELEADQEARKLFGDDMEAIEKFIPCYKLLKVETVIAPGKVKGGTSKSVLFDACIMAKDLRKLDKEERWKLMSKVWVELLCYAASNCKPHAHAQQLSKGGEFISFVWLLMFRFGMGEQFRVDPESRYKLIVG